MKTPKFGVGLVPFIMPDDVKVTKKEFRCTWRNSPNVFGEPSDYTVILIKEDNRIRIAGEGPGGSEHITQVDIAIALARLRGWLTSRDRLFWSSPYSEKAMKFVKEQK